MMVTRPRKKVPTAGATMIQSSTTSANASTVATRTMLTASGNEMKRHLVVVSLKR